MGTRISQPVPEYSTNCSICTPSLWADCETPKYVYVYFDGIVNCGWSEKTPPNGQTFRCEQVEGSPCFWRHDGDEWYVEFHAKREGHDYSFVILNDSKGWAFFSGTGDICPPEFTLIDNDQASCILFYAGCKGSALISYHDFTSILAVWFGLTAGSTLFSELFVGPDGYIVVKLCDKYTSSNIKYKVDPNEI